jgi:hypothetical protein
VSEPESDLSPPVPARGILRLAGLALLVGLWLVPWADVQGADGSPHPEVGAARTGAAACVALVGLWGLGVTTLVARTRRGLRIGAALTDAGIALAATALLVAEHPWIPGGEIREAWIPIFAPLVLLALLDAAVQRWRPDAGDEVAYVRAGAALIAAGSLAVALSWMPAAVALWLGASPLALAVERRPAACRRILEGLILAGCAAVVLAPTIHGALVGVAEPVGASELARWGWTVAGVLVLLTALHGLVRPEGRAALA